MVRCLGKSQYSISNVRNKYRNKSKKVSTSKERDFQLILQIRAIFDYFLHERTYDKNTSFLMEQWTSTAEGF